MEHEIFTLLVTNFDVGWGSRPPTLFFLPWYGTVGMQGVLGKDSREHIYGALRFGRSWVSGVARRKLADGFWFCFLWLSIVPIGRAMLP